MPQMRTTLSIDSQVLRAARIAAARAGKRDSEIVEEALRSYLGLDVVAAVRERAGMDAEAADQLAYKELHASRTRR
jgi:hypothetical protein